MPSATASKASMPVPTTIWSSRSWRRSSSRGSVRCSAVDATPPSCSRTAISPSTPGARVARRGGREIALSAREAALLELFLRNPRRIVTREAALAARLGKHARSESRTASTSYVSYLRRKLGEPSLIETVRGVRLRASGTERALAARSLGAGGSRRHLRWRSCSPAPVSTCSPRATCTAPSTVRFAHGRSRSLS